MYNPQTDWAIRIEVDRHDNVRFVTNTPLSAEEQEVVDALIESKTEHESHEGLVYQFECGDCTIEYDPYIGEPQLI